MQALQSISDSRSEWLEWRRQGIGASDVSAIMGESEYQTVNDIWMDKRGMLPEKETSWAMQRGLDAEPKIRALYELYNDIEMPATLVEHPEFPYIRASLDGFNLDQVLILEIKYPGKEKHEQALNKIVPKTYYGQVQAQIEVVEKLTGKTARCDYVSYDGTNIAVVPVTRDQDYIDRMMPKLHAFWECVKNGTPPEPLKEKTKPIEDELFESYKRAKVDVELSQARLNEVSEAIKKKYPTGGVYCSGYELVFSAGRKTVDYAKVPQLQGVDLAPFTKVGNPSLTLRPRKE